MIASHSPFHSAHVASATPAAHRTVGELAADEKGVVLQSPTIAAVDEVPAPVKAGISSQQNSSASPSDASDTQTKPSSDDALQALREREAAAKAKVEQAELAQMQREIASLAARDREVRAHEQAHMAVGGQYAGAAQYQYERGPDGINYAVAGEVPIDLGRAADPQATIEKARTVRRAALAPADPSPQDRRIAAQASRLEAEALQELNEQRRAEQAEASEAKQSAREANSDDKSKSELGAAESTDNATQQASPTGIVSESSSNNTIASPALSNNQLKQVNTLVGVQSLASPRPNTILDDLV
ncbi:putative metalloprotease CJM1_0395 family protein [Saccharophagus degradans]|uniref:putative metalloprotease CJM1_0395 family protein n=1 Tax=Saccharophagus degradans TaxID=86304 RepID=UPI00339059A5